MNLMAGLLTTYVINHRSALKTLEEAELAEASSKAGSSPDDMLLACIPSCTRTVSLSVGVLLSVTYNLCFFGS